MKQDVQFLQETEAWLNAQCIISPYDVVSILSVLNLLGESSCDIVMQSVELTNSQTQQIVNHQK